ncbi:MAG: hypothetical protein P1T08_13790 [Acidimicrobiia bacterium]|nr:hypothetical protein [Acidimicrobiia bacterium]
MSQLDSSPDLTARRKLPDWWGWLVASALSVVIGVSWWPGFTYPLGDSTEGRILGRLGLQVRNFWEMGASASGWGTNLQPYGDTYAHHPPLTNIAQIIVYAVAGEGEAQLRVFGYLAGFFTVWALIVLLRQLAFGWAGPLVAVAALTSTTFFWAFGRLGGGFSASVGFLAAVAYLRRTEQPSAVAVGITAALGAASVLLAWPAAAVAALGGMWLLAGRGWDRPTRLVAAAGVVTALAMVVWILSATDLSELAGQARVRSSGAGFTWGQFADKQWVYAARLLPDWYLWLIVPSLAAGLVDARTRPVVIITGGVALAWMVGPREGAFSHEFWNLNWLLPITVGMAALVEFVKGWLNRVHASAATIAVGVVTVLLSVAVLGRIGTTAFRVGADAGALLDRIEPPPGQTAVWVAPNVAAPRWASWYWDLPVRVVTPDGLSGIPSDDLILIRSDAVPAWMGIDDDEMLATEGAYALVAGDALAD